MSALCIIRLRNKLELINDVVSFEQVALLVSDMLEFLIRVACEFGYFTVNIFKEVHYSDAKTSLKVYC